MAVGFGVGATVGFGVATVGALVGFPTVASRSTAAMTGAWVGRAVVAGMICGVVGVPDGSTEGVGETLGVGSTVGLEVGPPVGVGVSAGPVGWGVPGADDGGSSVEVGAVVRPPGVGEAKAIPDVGPPPVEGVIERPEIPTPSATAARTTFTTPRARTSRRR